ncbi:hypothetical protein GE09DRAFT_1071795, partial [Coniochaeta sp. 2T2.1]
MHNTIPPGLISPVYHYPPCFFSGFCEFSRFCRDILLLGGNTRVRCSCAVWTVISFFAFTFSFVHFCFLVTGNKKYRRRWEKKFDRGRFGCLLIVAVFREEKRRSKPSFLFLLFISFRDLVAYRRRRGELSSTLGAEGGACAYTHTEMVRWMDECERCVFFRHDDVLSSFTAGFPSRILWGRSTQQHGNGRTDRIERRES